MHRGNAEKEYLYPANRYISSIYFSLPYAFKNQKRAFWTLPIRLYISVIIVKGIHNCLVCISFHVHTLSQNDSVNEKRHSVYNTVLF